MVEYRGREVQDTVLESSSIIENAPYHLADPTTATNARSVSRSMSGVSYRSVSRSMSGVVSQPSKLEKTLEAGTLE